MKTFLLLLTCATATVALAGGGMHATHEHAAGEHASGDAAMCADGCCAGEMTTAAVSGAENSSGLVAHYEKVSSALASDDLEAAHAAAAELGAWAGAAKQPGLSSAAAKVAQAASLDDARTAFKALSAVAIPLAEHAGAHFVMFCPMANAEWMQTKADIANPYYGTKMLRCGTVRKTIEAKS